MKKTLLLATALLFTACSTQTPQPKPLSFKSIDLLDKYGINEDSLIKYKNAYYFVVEAPQGAKIVKLDKNYKEVWHKTTPIVVEPIKTVIANDTIYLLGYDQKKNLPVLLEFSLDSKLKKISYYGKKFDIPRDLIIINHTPYVGITHYSKNNDSDIVIYGGKRTITLSTPNMDNVTFIKPYKNGILIIGSTQNRNDDVLIAYKTLENKTIWSKKLDMGMDEAPLSVEIKNNLIYLKVTSTDHMGAETEATFIIDDKGNIKSVKKGIEFKQLPVKYRT